MSTVPSDAESGFLQSDDEARESEVAAPMDPRVSQSHHNDALPIHRLASEILSSIFCSVWCENYAQDVRNLLNLSSVCHHWREVALGCPRLWTRIKPLRQPLFDLILGRSKQAPLDIEFTTGYYIVPKMPYQEYIALVLPHARRWRTCCLRYRADAEELTFSPLESMPLLEALTIGRMYAWDRATDSEPSTPLPPSYAPRLGVLALEGAFIPFTHPFYSSLTELSLSRISFSKLDSMQGLLHGLEASPLLKRLRLESLELSFHITPNSIHPSTSLVHLHHLQVLHIEAMAPDWIARYILASLAIPPCALIKLLCFQFSDDTPNMSTFLPSHEHIQVSLPALSSAFALHITFSRNMIDCDVEGYTREHKQLFAFHLLTLPGPGSSVVFANLGTILPTPSLQSFSLFDMNSSNPADAAAVADFLIRHPFIAQLGFEKCHESMIQILLDMSICPRLESLRIAKCTLSPGNMVEIVELRARPKYSELEVCVIDSVCRLNTLEVSGCPQFKPILRTLRKRDVVVECEEE
ncbi:hypothetical protein BOTBODRAFT_35370 [Botryobasidium botryosum FD-172 SS1]|uniref:F-box domain-containing protein n=1 Tax=Botryobasidium botryosum (strain FD-172 SS1) TaxID=930990 RepID=A0A067MHX2_BOTB1|nr:hypothetical protein BOTBODRAFT_35370 [Botryobasidium botryosum FD-172 SS1]